MARPNHTPRLSRRRKRPVADVSLTEELIDEAALGDGVARRLLGDLAYRSEGLKEALATLI